MDPKFLPPQRDDEAMVERLEVQLALLEDYADNAFVQGKHHYYSEVATKLRLLLVRSRNNVPLLIELAGRFDVPLIVTLALHPVKRPDDPTGQITLDQFFDMTAYMYKGETGVIKVSKRQIIRAWCEQYGGAHEDWAVDDWVRLALRPHMLIFNGLHPVQIELQNSTKAVLQYGQHLLASIREQKKESASAGDA